PAVSGLARRLVRAAPLAAAAVSVAGFAWALPMEDRIYPLPILGRDDLREAYLALSRQPDVTGLIDQSGACWCRTGGYFDLNRPAPLYRPDIVATRMSLVMNAPQRYASHWLLPARASTPPGYRPFETFGAYRIVRRERDPAGTRAPPGYATTT